METRKKAGFILGFLFFLIAYFSPILSQNPRAHNLLAIFLLIVIWWVTECIPLPVTALFIPVLITAFKIASVKEAFAPFSNPIILLFLGSFILARAMCVHGLDQKLAHSVLSLKSVANKKLRMLFALGLISLFLSMWISNTATTAMMYPIALGVLDASQSQKARKRETTFSVILLLTLAYAASIGGIGTPVGSPPNLIAIGFLDSLVGVQINFFQWMLVGFLILIPMYFALFLIMKYHIKKTPAKAPIKLRSPNINSGKRKLNRGQKNVLFAFSITASLWIFPGVISLISGRDNPVFLWLHDRFPESTAALIGAGLLFLLPTPSSKTPFTLSLKEALKVDWGTLLLFGGGLSLGFQMFETGLADAIGNSFISLGGNSASLALITLLTITFSIFLTELTSNTASANMILPIVIAVSQAASINPLPPVLGSAIGCSFAFMLPVATPPNAIVYGSGLIRLPQMIKFGFWLNIVGILLIWMGTAFIAPLLGLI